MFSVLFKFYFLLFFVPLYAGESRGIYCGGKTLRNTRNLEIAGSQAYVRFKSDSAYTGKGFSLSFKTQVSG